MSSSLYLSILCSKEKVIEILPKYIALFKFLLEGYDHLCLLTVLDPKKALIKISYYPTEEEFVQAFIEDFKNFQIPS